MRITTKLFVAALCVAMTGTAYAELQDVEVGGSIRIRGNWFSSSTLDSFNGRNSLVQPFFAGGSPRPAGNPLQGLRYRALQLFNRSVGVAPLGGFTGGPLSSASFIDFNDDGHSSAFVEQRTLLNVSADFTNDVSVFIEFERYDDWGNDFRSDYITGRDFAGGGDDVQLYQAYIEANEMFGYPLRLRIGRQEMVFGSGWLMGNNTTSSIFTGLYYDGVRLTVGDDDYSIDAFWAKLEETFGVEEDGDTDFMGVYGSYMGIESMTIDAYFLWLRDAAQVQDTFNFAEWTPLRLIEDWVGVDDYDTTNIFTVGARVNGDWALGGGSLGLEAEAAYQFGDAGSTGFLFRGPGLVLSYGDNEAEYDQFAAHFELGYTFDTSYQPRIFIGAAYFGGEDNRDLSFVEWLETLVNPFYTPDASISFNRLFSSWEYSEFFTQMSNAYMLRGGFSISPTESVDVSLLVTYHEALEAFEAPYEFKIGDQRFVPLAGLSFLTEENDTDLGIEVGLYVDYQYSEDLVFRAGWAHLFTGDGAEEGAFVSFNGLGFEGGTSDDDLDYLFLETEISF